jgi:hypothetical protein
MGPLELALLAEVMGIGDRGEVIREFSLLAGESQESPWVISFPEGLMSRVSELSEGDVEAVARRWAEAGEHAAGANLDALQAFLKALVAFARHSDGPYALYIRLDTA